MRVLVAVDLHASGEQVVEHARDLILRSGATVDLVFVASWTTAPLYIDEPSVSTVMDMQFDEARREARKTLRRLLERFPAKQRGEALVPEGSPGRTVAALAEKYDAVIVGTHGRTGLNHLFMGSVAERVVRFSPVPVLVVPVGDEGEEEGAAEEPG